MTVPFRVENVRCTHTLHSLNDAWSMVDVLAHCIGRPTVQWTVMALGTDMSVPPGMALLLCWTLLY
jgi:hypothetical protein